MTSSTDPILARCLVMATTRLGCLETSWLDTLKSMSPTVDISRSDDPHHFLLGRRGLSVGLFDTSRPKSPRLAFDRR